MPSKYALSSLGVMVRRKRGPRKLREVAREIGITAPTLMRIESGRVPDVATFGKVCVWLAVDPGDFLGHPKKSEAEEASNAEPAVRVSAHFKADHFPLPETATALARMLLFVAQRQAASSISLDDVDA
jgi:transcriptional regulator with XRE-family HTH domain